MTDSQIRSAVRRYDRWNGPASAMLIALYWSAVAAMILWGVTR